VPENKSKKSSVYVSQVIMLYTLKLHRAAGQLRLNGTERKKRKYMYTKGPKYPSTGNWINKLWYTNPTKHHSPITSNDALINTTAHKILKKYSEKKKPHIKEYLL